MLDGILANGFEVLKVLLVLVAIGAVMGIIAGAFGGKNRKKRSKCTRCKRTYNYDSDIAWKVIRSKASGSVFGNPKSKITVAISCRCASCGQIKSLTRKYTHAEYKKGIFGASVKQNSVDELVRRDFL